MIIQCRHCRRVKLKSGGFYPRGWDKEGREWWGEPAERRVVPETDRVKKEECPDCLRKRSTGVHKGKEE